MGDKCSSKVNLRFSAILTGEEDALLNQRYANRKYKSKLSDVQADIFKDGLHSLSREVLTALLVTCSLVTDIPEFPENVRKEVSEFCKRKLDLTSGRETE